MAHPEFCKYGHADWYIDLTTNQRRCRVCKKAAANARWANIPFIERQKRWMSQEYKNYVRDRNRHIRMEVILAYGGECACCHEWRYELLAMDHINGGGNDQRKEMKGARLEPWLKKNGYPEGYRVLCHSCNQSYGLYGYCPHQEE